MEPNRIELDRHSEHWIVRIYEDGEVIERSFVFLAAAKAYAEGQAYRLTRSFDFFDKTASDRGY